MPHDQTAGFPVRGCLLPTAACAFVDVLLPTQDATCTAGSRSSRLLPHGRRCRRTGWLRVEATRHALRLTGDGRRGTWGRLMRCTAQPAARMTLQWSVVRSSARDGCLAIRMLEGAMCGVAGTVHESLIQHRAHRRGRPPLLCRTETPRPAALPAVMPFTRQSGRGVFGPKLPGIPGEYSTRWSPAAELFTAVSG